jgi:hypothetical protein
MIQVVRSLIEYGSLEEAYPSVDPEFQPYGNFILFQLRTPKNRTRGGIELPQTAGIEDIAQWNTQVARVVKLGPVCFKNRDTLAPWPEGDWCKEGDFVRIPLHGGDRWYLPVPGRSDHRALFAVYRDLDVKGEYKGDPLLVDPYI